MDQPDNQKKLPVFVSFSAEINQSTAEALIGVIAKQALNGAQTVHLALSTPGGRTDCGVTIYNVLKALPIRLITHNVGMVNSIGNVVFLAGEERVATPASSFMFHGVGFTLPQEARFEEKDLKEKLANLENDQGLIADIIADRTEIDAEQVASLFLRAAFMRAEEARERGIVHGIREFKVPQGANFLQLSFKR